MFIRNDMMLKSYPAGKGDSFLLSWGPVDDQKHLLIDSGIPGTYRFMKADLQCLKQLDGVIITHVDYDHLGGFFKLLADQNPPVPKSFPVYMNTPSLAFTPQEDDKINLEHGIKLDKKLSDIGIVSKPLYNGFALDNLLTIDELQIKILSPPQKVIDELLLKWTAENLYKQYQKESQDSDKVGKPIDNPISYEDVITGSETAHQWEDDLINSSSIAFIVSYAGCTILLLGDANPNLIVEELGRLGFNSLNRLKVDLVKVSHHGCKHNSNRALFSAIECDNYLISSNGAGPYYHPDRETIIRLAEYGRPAKETPLNIYLNYNLDTSNFITTKEATDWKINFIHQVTFNFHYCKCSQKK